MESLIINAMMLAFGVALLFSKKYSCLRLVQVFAFGSVAAELIYRSLFYNWYFYLAYVIFESILFALAYWEVNKKLENRSIHWTWPVIAAILSVPFWGLAFVLKTAIPFMIVNLFIAFDISYAIRSKNPFLRVWTITSSFALALGGLALIISNNEVRGLLSTIGLLPRVLGDTALLLIVVWQPLMAWLAPKLQPYLPNTGLEPVLATAGEDETLATQAHAADVINFPRKSQKLLPGEMEAIQQVSDDMDLLEPLLMSATRMISLSNKPFLNLEDLRDYLDLDEKQIEVFLQKHDIKKFHLLEDNDQWVVRRKDVEDNPADGNTSIRTHDKF